MARYLTGLNTDYCTDSHLFFVEDGFRFLSWCLYTLYLLVCQVKDTVRDSGKVCSVPFSFVVVVVVAVVVLSPPPSLSLSIYLS